MGCIHAVPEDQVYIVEYFGAFDKEVHGGFLCIAPCFCSKAGSVSTRIQQLVCHCETKTKDNVFLNVSIAIQFQVIPGKIYDAFYRLTNPGQQIQAYVFDVIRGLLPTKTLDEVFEIQSDLAQSVKATLDKTMTTYGFHIHECLVIDINPDSKVRSAMNEINANKRLKLAATEKAQADKIITVARAVADAESKHLQGYGVSRQRKAIVDGLRSSVGEFSDSAGMSAKQVLEMVLMTQYFDTLKEIGGDKHTKACFINTPSQEDKSLSIFRTALLQSKAMPQAALAA